jgi:hypothetical protein
MSTGGSTKSNVRSFEAFLKIYLPTIIRNQRYREIVRYVGLVPNLNVL